MKLIYKEGKWIKHSKLVSLNKLKRRKRKIDKKETLIRLSAQQIRHIDRKKKVTILCPANFSIINNCEEMLLLFKQIHDNVVKLNPTFLDMSYVKYMTTDAILYMLSRFNHYEDCHDYKFFSGNLPNDQKCKSIIYHSGFYKYVTQLKSVVTDKVSILSIEDGSLVDGVIAKKVLDFTRDALNKEDKFYTRKIYETIIECMSNTNNHAYDNTGNEKRWWLMALHDQENKKVIFTFLDNGFGIPTTIKRSFIEIIKNKLSKLSDNLVVQHNKLMLSALNGDFRTRTNLEHRGNGLPKIYSHSNNKIIEDLIIISNKGYVDCHNSNYIELNNTFHGTLISWSFV